MSGEQATQPQDMHRAHESLLNHLRYHDGVWNYRAGHLLSLWKLLGSFHRHTPRAFRIANTIWASGSPTSVDLSLAIYIDWRDALCMGSDRLFFRMW